MERNSSLRHFLTAEHREDLDRELATAREALTPTARWTLAEHFGIVPKDATRRALTPAEWEAIRFGAPCRLPSQRNASLEACWRRLSVTGSSHPRNASVGYRMETSVGQRDYGGSRVARLSLSSSLR